MNLSFREYLEMESVVFGEALVEATADQLLAYLGAIVDDDVDLSGATIDGLVKIEDQTFNDFDALNADFNDGIIIKNCTFRGNLSFQEGNVDKLFVLENVKVQGILTMPNNLEEIARDGKVGLVNFQGNVAFGYQ